MFYTHSLAGFFSVANLDNSNTNALLGHSRTGERDPEAQARLVVWHPLRLWVFMVSSMSSSQFLVTSSTYGRGLLCSPAHQSWGCSSTQSWAPQCGWRVTSGLTGKCGHSHQQWLEPLFGLSRPLSHHHFPLCWAFPLSPQHCSLPFLHRPKHYRTEKNSRYSFSGATSSHPPHKALANMAVRIQETASLNRKVIC